LKVEDDRLQKKARGEGQEARNTTPLTSVLKGGGLEDSSL